MRILSFAASAAAAFLLPLLVSSPSYAGEQPAENRLPALVVSGSAEPSEARTLPTSVQVIGREQMERSGASTLGELLTRTSATMVLMQPGNYTKFSLRGFSSGKSAGTPLSDRALLLIDGNRAGTGNLNYIPVVGIDRIEILRGPASVLYGGSAMGGVINVITARGTGEVKTRLGAEYGSWDKRSFHAGVGGAGKDNRWGAAAAAQMDGSSDYEDGRGQRYKNSHYNRAGGSAALAFRPREATSFSGTGIFHKTYDTGSPGDIYYSTPHSSLENAYSYGALGMDSGLDNGVRLRGNFYANQNIYDDINREGAGYTTTIDSRMFGGRGVVGIPLGELADIPLGRFSLGAEYITHRQDMRGSSKWEPNNTTDVYSAFAEHKLDYKSLSLLYGLRFDHYKTGTRDTNGLDVRGEDKTFEQVTWTGGATWWVLDWLGLRASVGTAYVPPNSMEMSGQYTVHSTWGDYLYRGNPDLKAEKSLTTGFGIEVERGGFSGNLGYFHTKYKDRIGTVPTWGFPTTTYDYINQDDITLAGVEGNLAYAGDVKIGGETLRYAPYASWEVFTERRNPNGAGLARTLTDTPEYTVTAGLGLGVGMVWLDVNAQFVGSQVAADFGNNWVMRRFDGFEIYNARLTVTPVRDLQLYAGVDNLADTYYGYKPEFPLPGRSYTVGVNYAF